jgi:hypothetical protein
MYSFKLFLFYFFLNKYIFCKIYYFYNLRLYLSQIRGGFINWDLDYLRKLWCCVKITRRADCANKRRIYKLGWGLRKLWCCVKITRRADCANKRRIYKLGFGLFAKVVMWDEITVRDCLFVKINRAYILDEFF